MQSFWQDVRYALRTFKKNPAGTVIAVLAAALGIGGATLMFSSADATFRAEDECDRACARRRNQRCAKHTAGTGHA